MGQLELRSHATGLVPTLNQTQNCDPALNIFIVLEPVAFLLEDKHSLFQGTIMVGNLDFELLGHYNMVVLPPLSLRLGFLLPSEVLYL